METGNTDNNESLLLLGIFHYAVAIFLIIVKFAPFNINLYDLYLTEHTSDVLLVDTIIVGTILYALTITKKAKITTKRIKKEQKSLKIYKNIKNTKNARQNQNFAPPKSNKNASHPQRVYSQYSRLHYDMSALKHQNPIDSS